MAAGARHDRAYFQSRLREEIDRCGRYGRCFSLALFEAIPVADGVPIRRRIEWAAGKLAATIRPSDVIAIVFEDTVGVLLVEADNLNARDALMRLRNRLQGSGVWRITSLSFPRDAAAVAALPLLTAA